MSENQATCSEEELEQMFNQTFLPGIDAIASREINQHFTNENGETDITHVQLSLNFHYALKQRPISYKVIQEQIAFKMNLIKDPNPEVVVEPAQQDS